ncbi:MULTISPECIES: hypothetical protein [Silvimonas]|uniref:hypothetical protein n=1 Tax=Silvimonas TaxID=300264 RepID=UPI0024B3771D|nr:MULTISPECIES: hypothetical protein [Silvimonas]MDR3428949.1 hypothetical protein [Silvimonas sp.]
MKSTHALILPAALLALLAVTQPAFAADASAPAAQIIDAGGAAQVGHAKGVIIAIDPATRVVSIKGEKGHVVDVTNPPEVKNFDQLKVGDKVSVEYRRSIALALKRGGNGIRSEVETTAKASAAAGEKPGGMEVRRRTLVANVLSVNHKTQTITVKGPKNRVVDVKVEDPAVFKEIKKGDQIVAVVTDALAVSVTPGN